MILNTFDLRSCFNATKELLYMKHWHEDEEFTVSPHTFQISADSTVLKLSKVQPHKNLNMSALLLRDVTSAVPSPEH